MTNLPLDYDQIESALQTLGADINTSEIHGTLCAILCVDGQLDADNWYQSSIPETDNNDLLQNEAKQMLSLFYNETRQHLNDPTCDFQLMLPVGDNDLNARTIALGDWCQGFIMGLMTCGIKDFRKMPENSAEVTQDIVEISRAGTTYESEDSEEDAVALEELIEYVRVGVLLINEEFHPDKKAPVTSSGYNNLH
jgi:yecA family protein